MIIYTANNNTLKGIINQKYVFGKKILEQDLNKECYFDFIFKIISIILFDENISPEDNYKTEYLKKNYDRLLENKKELDNDKLLKAYEKILLLIEAYLSELIYEENYILKYFHKNRIVKDSPLSYAYEFLQKFVENLDYDSNFYYPLLSIDSGLYKYNLIKKMVLNLYQYMDLI